MKLGDEITYLGARAIVSEIRGSNEVITSQRTLENAITHELITDTVMGLEEYVDLISFTPNGDNQNPHIVRNVHFIDGVAQ